MFSKFQESIYLPGIERWGIEIYMNATHPGCSNLYSTSTTTQIPYSKKRQKTASHT